MRRKDYRILLFFCVILVCMGGGMLLPEIINMNTGTYAGFFSMYSFGKFQQQEIRMRDMFLYIFSVRMELLLFLWLSCFTGAGIWLHALAGGWISCSAGMLLRLFLMKKGLQGAALFFCSLMPQWLLYGMIWKKELVFCLKRMKGEKGKKREIVTLLFQLLALCISGCACETWIGLQLQKKFFTFFM